MSVRNELSVNYLSTNRKLKFENGRQVIYERRSLHEYVRNKAFEISNFKHTLNPDTASVTGQTKSRYICFKCIYSKMLQKDLNKNRNYTME